MRSHSGFAAKAALPLIMPMIDLPSYEPHTAFSTEEKFALGRVVATTGAVNAIPIDEIEAGLRRHHAGDWGELDEHDRQENELSLQKRFRLLSAYRSKAGVKFWIITEADRTVTTVLLPEEY